MSPRPDRACSETRRERRGCHHCVPWAGSLSLGRWTRPFTRSLYHNHNQPKGQRHMKRVLILLLAASSLVSAQDKDNATDRAAIEALGTRWQETWNRHDMDALSML